VVAFTSKRCKRFRDAAGLAVSLEPSLRQAPKNEAWCAQGNIGQATLRHLIWNRNRPCDLDAQIRQRDVGKKFASGIASKPAVKSLGCGTKADKLTTKPIPEKTVLQCRIVQPFSLGIIGLELSSAS
jgi:hypothetical protein